MRALRLIAAATTTVIVVIGAAAAPVAASGQQWDPRIEDLAHEVERLRGLEFDHPVPVRVLDDDAFDARYNKEQKITKAYRKQFERTNASLLAVGLLEEPVDIDSFGSAFGSRILGYYDDQRQQIVVRGDTFKRASTRVTLAHELTHALQDQHFDVHRVMQKGSGTESGVPRALIEGDATRIEDKYKDGLSAAERDEIDDDTATAIDEAADLPPVIGVTTSGSYYLGEVVTMLLDADGGQHAVDDAFRDPPLDDLVLLDPEALLDSFRATKVPAPTLAKGERALGKSYVFGAWGLYLVLASRLPSADALAAAERWGGDAYVTFQRGSTPCVRVTMAGRHGRTDAEALDTAFQAWAAAAPSDAKTVVEDKTVTLTSCAPAGGAAPVSEGALTRALTHVAIRNSLAVSGLEAGLDPGQAKCLGTEVVHLPEVSKALDGFTSLDGDAPADFETTFQTAVTKNAAAIRARCV